MDQDVIDIDVQMKGSEPIRPISKLDIQRYIHSTNDAQKYLDGLNEYRSMFLNRETQTDQFQNKYLETLKALLKLNWDFISLMQGVEKKED